MARARRKASAVSTSWVDTKISATVIDFGQPMLQQLPADASPALLQASFELLVSFWNVNVMATHWGQPGHRDAMRLKFMQAVADRSAPVEMLATFEQLCQRYRQHPFVDDPRAIGHWKLRHLLDGQVNLQCDARLPPGMDSPTPPSGPL